MKQQQFLVATVNWALSAVLLLMLAPASLAAQSRTGSITEFSIGHAAPGCRVMATVAGAGAGMFLGGLIGYHVERAFYKSNEDAGVTGLAIGSIGGAIAGIQIARKACKERGEQELRSQLHLQLSQQSRETHPSGHEPMMPSCKCGRPGVATLRDASAEPRVAATGADLARF